MSLSELEKKNWNYVLITEFIFDDTRSVLLCSYVPTIIGAVVNNNNNNNNGVQFSRLFVDVLAQQNS